MAIKINSSDKEVVKNYSLYTGVIPLCVKAINPTKEQAKQLLSMEMENEPKYLDMVDNSTKTGTVRRVRLDLWLGLQAGKSFNYLGKNGEAKTLDKDFRVKLTFFIQDEDFHSTKNPDKFQVINAYGNSAWFDDISVSPFTWFKMEGVRKAKRGEADFYEFLKTWLNVDPKDPVELANLDAILSGDVRELWSYLQMVPNNEVKVLLGVRHTEDGKAYQDVYTRKFGRATEGNFTNWVKHFGKNEWSSGTSTVEYILEFSEIDPKLPSPTKYTGAQSGSDGDIDPPAYMASSEDAPF